MDQRKFLMRRGSVLILLSVVLVAGYILITNVVQGGTVIDWVPFVRFQGVTYEVDLPFDAHRIDDADLGPQFARVQRNVADTVHNPYYRVKDGDAAFLAPDTPVFTVKGYHPTFRLPRTWTGA